MCHLFAISSSAPRPIEPFLPAIAPFAETESPHGWGFAALSVGRTTLVKEPRSFAAAWREAGPAVTRAARTAGETMLFHIREASVGKHTLENTHPFRRRVLGRTFLFMHNGTVREVKKRPLRRLDPVGDTDSEHAFLWLLESLPPDPPRRLARWLKDAGNAIRTLGKFNFVMAEGDTIWAYADTALTWCARAETIDDRPAAGTTPPRRTGLAGRSKRTARSVLVATCPFTADTGDAWHPMAPGELLVARRGRVMEIV
jgi:glutamine amidotransferase